jgi:peptidylprolyl isomerase
MEKKNNMNMVVSVIVVLALIGVLIFISINKKEDNMLNSNNNSSGNVTSANDVAKTGLPAQAGDTVSMNYTGRLENGVVFDSNVDPKFNHVEPFVFILGAGQVIPGWDEGIVGMKVGDKKTLVVPPEKAYGPNDYGPIPGNSTLTFDVELVSIIK